MVDFVILSWMWGWMLLSLTNTWWLQTQTWTSVLRGRRHCHSTSTSYVKVLSCYWKSSCTFMTTAWADGLVHTSTWHSPQLDLETIYRYKLSGLFLMWHLMIDDQFHSAVTMNWSSESGLHEWNFSLTHTRQCCSLSTHLRNQLRVEWPLIREKYSSTSGKIIFLYIFPYYDQWYCLPKIRHNCINNKLNNMNYGRQ